MKFLKKLEKWENSILIAVTISSIWLLIIWYVLNWEHLPEWVPLPGLPLMDILSCLGVPLFCLTGLPAFVILCIGIVGNLVTFVKRLYDGSLSASIKMGVSLIIFGVALLPWLYKEEIDRAGVNQAVERYEPVIEAIEAYRVENGYYPETIQKLVPVYLTKIPGIYMKYGMDLTYQPKTTDRLDHAPFVFELYGGYAGVHGQTLKYCPASIEPCYEGVEGLYTVERINERWIWVYSSAF